MFGSLKALWGDAQAGYAKFKDRETAEGVVAIMVGTSNADGEFEPAEKAKFIAGRKSIRLR